MAMYVYKDAARTDKLHAKEAQKQNKGKRYYCPNPECDAHMYLWNVDGVSAAYFRASRSYKHREGCPYGIKNGFNPNEYDEEKFDFDNAILALTIQSKVQSKNEEPGEHGSGTGISKPPRTIRQIYSMCKAYDYSDKYNGITIGKMLIDNRSIFMYPKGVFGWRIIETKCKRPRFYDSNKMEISLVASTVGEEYTFILNFDNEGLFKEIKNTIFPNKEYLIVVAGQWSSSGTFNIFCASINSKKQLAIIK